MELRQLRFFVTLAEELHFGRAAAREHIVQSALSQQLQRLERELGVRLLERNTHHVQLTAAGVAFLAEVRQILAHVGRAAANAGRVVAPILRVGVVDPSYDSMPQILGRIRDRYPELEIHECELGVPDQVSMLADGRLDIGMGRAVPAGPQVCAELFRLDPLGVLLSQDNGLAAARQVPVTALGSERLLFADEARAPEFNQFITDLCIAAGFLPTVYRGTVGSIRAASELVRQGRCVVCVPASGVPAPWAAPIPGVVWRPLAEPVPRYPWSLLWRAGDTSEHVAAAVAVARRLSAELRWLRSAVRAA